MIDNRSCYGNIVYLAILHVLENSDDEVVAAAVMKRVKDVLKASNVYEWEMVIDVLMSHELDLLFECFFLIVEGMVYNLEKFQQVWTFSGDE